MKRTIEGDYRHVNILNVDGIELDTSGVIPKIKVDFDSVDGISGDAVEFPSSSGTTAERPTTTIVGFMYFDTTIGYPIWWNGAAWFNAGGIPS